MEIALRVHVGLEYLRMYWTDFHQMNACLVQMIDLDLIFSISQGTLPMCRVVLAHVGPSCRACRPVLSRDSSVDLSRDESSW